MGSRRHDGDNSYLTAQSGHDDEIWTGEQISCYHGENLISICQKLVKLDKAAAPITLVGVAGFRMG